jgi:hypothetical protein
MEDTTATRAATKSRIGPWYVLQTRNPSAPGMKWSTLLTLIDKGQVSPRSVVRGPTTHQLWRFAAHVKGLSREFGVCYSCGGKIERTTHQCPHCQKIQELPANPDALLESRAEPVMREIEQPASLAPAPKPPLKLSPPEAPRRKPSDITLPPRGEIGHPPGVEPRSDWHPDPAILSARELAQAFQLDFNVDEPPPRRRRALRALLTFLVLGALALTGVMLIWTDLREQTFAWLGHASATVQGYFQGSGRSARAVDPPPAAAPAQLDAPKPATQPIRLRATVELPATRPAHASAEPAKMADPPSTGTPGAAANVAAHITTPPPKTDAMVDVTANANEDPVDQARALWSHAIDAEAKQDFPEAIKFYEQIKKLPATAWPAGLEIRLTAARRQVQ